MEVYETGNEDRRKGLVRSFFNQYPLVNKSDDNQGLEGRVYFVKESKL